MVVIIIFIFCHLFFVNSRGDLSRGLCGRIHDIILISGTVQRYEWFFIEAIQWGCP